MNEFFFSQLKKELRADSIIPAFQKIVEVEKQLEDKGVDSFAVCLSEWEYNYLKGLKVLKRIADFLSGRLAGKKAVKEYLESIACSKNISPSAIDIRRLESGEPAVFLNEKRMDLHLSITHSGKFAASIVTDSGDYCGIGIDMEKIEGRDDLFFNIAFTDDEIERINTSGPHKDEKVTLYWAVKEALLKSMASGLNLNLKEINVNDTEGSVVMVDIKGGVLDTFECLCGVYPVVKQYKVDGYIISTSFIKRKQNELTEK